jgi:2-dehydropantoate 2-reductase
VSSLIILSPPRHVLKFETMNKDNPSILVIGAGAIGGITAALLRHSGYDVTIAAKYPDYAEKIREDGIMISGFRGIHTVQIPAVAAVSELKEKKDIILLATKATDMASSAHDALPLLNEGGYMVSMQNGICEYELASIIGMERTVGCVVGWGATMVSPGEMIMTSGGDFILGYPDRVPDDDLNALVKILSDVVPARTTSNILGHLYSKLIINACITSMGAVCGLYLGKMLSLHRMRRIFINVISEAVTVANAMNLKIEVFGGKLDFYKFVEKNGFFADVKRNLVIMVIGFKYRRLKSSSLQSLERGKPTEISYFNGFIVDNAVKYNIQVPVNSKIVDIVKQIEKGLLPVSINNFDDSAFD